MATLNSNWVKPSSHILMVSRRTLRPKCLPDGVADSAETVAM